MPDAQAVIETLQFIRKQVFIISGGLEDAVIGFGQRLGVPAEHIRAVPLEYNELSGEWWRYYDPSTRNAQSYLDYAEGPLTVSSGKPSIVRELAGNRFGRRILVGDGVSDLATRQDSVNLFVGFGGVAVREKVEKEADVFIYPATLAPMLPLTAGYEGWLAVRGTAFETVYLKGIKLGLSEAVRFRDEELQAAFVNEFSRVPLDEGE
jgi:phosphoserine phosphatase